MKSSIGELNVPIRSYYLIPSNGPGPLACSLIPDSLIMTNETKAFDSAHRR